MIAKIRTIWFILNHILEITDGISTRLDGHDVDMRILTAHWPKP